MPLADRRRSVPRTDAVLADDRLRPALQRLGRAAVKRTVVDVLARIRAGELDPDAAVDAALAAFPTRATTLQPVLNATGVVLHTNLGRAPLSAAAIDAVAAAAGYVDVEFDLDAATRARRGRGTLDALRAAAPDAEDVLVVNNGAAALVLATTAFADAREVIVSRGEMVEIGDGFRLHELIASTGARLHEVGTTNRVRRDDYAAAIGPETGCVLKVHPSNFRVEGFTSSVPARELADLGVPLVVDVGSGLLAPEPMLPDEPDVASALRAGASVVTCSGDKLTGGPQAGLIFGTAHAVETLRRHPLARALRVDKLTLAALEATLTGPVPPAHAYLHADPDELRRRCGALATALTTELGAAPDVVASAGAVGGGGAPGQALRGWAVALPPSFAARLRRGSPAVVGRIERDHLLLDLRCIPVEADAALADAVRRAAGDVRAEH